MRTTRTILRSIVAVVAGYLASALLIGVTVPLVGALIPASLSPANTGWVMANVAYGCVFAAVGGYLTAWLAPSRSLAHALVLGLLMAVFAALTGWAIANSPPLPGYADQPGWYYPALALTVGAAGAPAPPPANRLAPR